MRILAALGDDALSGGVDPGTADVQARKVAAGARVLAALAAEHEVVLAHGYPLALLADDAESPLGRRLDLALRNALPDRDLVTILTGVIVDAYKPASPPEGKPIGAMRAAEPKAIAELNSLRALIDSGALVICAWGGGIPIALDEAGAMEEAEAVVEGDLTAALLARRLDADLFVLLGGAPGAPSTWVADGDRPARSTSPERLRAAGLAAGSIGPTVEAACRFVESTGRRAAIGELPDAVEIARGAAGTQIAVRTA